MTHSASPGPGPRDPSGASTEERNALLRTLYETVGPRILSLGHRYFGGRRDLAEELVAETFARVIAGIGRFGGRSSYDTWIFRIAMNVAAQWIRTEIAHRGATPEVTAAARGRTSEGADVDERKRLVDDAVRALSPEHRMVLALVVVDGLAQSDVAGLLGVAEGTVWSRYARARVALAREFERRGLAAEDL
jgi:RNA polymerase sigma-70 factor (ECF subfamily)